MVRPVLAISLRLAFILLGCGSPDDPSSESGGEAQSVAPSARYAFRCTGKQIERLGEPGSFSTVGGGDRAAEFDVTLAPGAAAVLSVIAGTGGTTTLSVLSPDGKTRSAVAKDEGSFPTLIKYATLANSWTAEKTYHVSAKVGPTGNGGLISFCTTLTDSTQPTPKIGGCKAAQPDHSCKTEGDQPGTCHAEEFQWTNVGDDHAVGMCEAK
jgi:hypothetical protein